MNVAEKIKKIFLKNSSRALLVVSAAKGVTDILISYAMGKEEALYEVEKIYMDIAQKIGEKSTEDKVVELIKELRSAYGSCESKERCLHVIPSYGERISAVLLNGAYISIGEQAEQINALKSIIAQERNGNISIDYKATSEALSKELLRFERKSSIFITEGFIASLPDGKVVTLGRGGSDYTATALAAVLSADETYLVTETEGIMSGDPKVVKRPKRVELLDSDEAEIASRLGVKKLHPKTFEPLEFFSHPKNIYITSINGVGTRICSEYGCSGKGVKILSLKSNDEEKQLAVIGRNAPDEAISVIKKDPVFSRFIKKIDVVSPVLLFTIFERSSPLFDLFNYIHDRLIWGGVYNG